MWSKPEETSNPKACFQESSNSPSTASSATNQFTVLDLHGCEDRDYVLMDFNGFLTALRAALRAKDRVKGLHQSARQ